MGRWEPIWIASLEIEPWIEQKIELKHGVDGETIRKYFVGSNHVSGGKIFDYKHGARTWAFTAFTTGKFLLVHINLVNRDYSAWSLRTARVTSQIPYARR